MCYHRKATLGNLRVWPNLFDYTHNDINVDIFSEVASQIQLETHQYHGCEIWYFSAKQDSDEPRSSAKVRYCADNGGSDQGRKVTLCLN